MSAPIWRSGETTRPIGRFWIEASPLNFVVKFWPARIPVSRRIVVPEFPASSARQLDFQTFGAAAGDFYQSLSILTLAPSALMQSSVLWQSAATCEMAEFAGAFGEGRKHRVAVRDRFISRRSDAAGQEFGWVDGLLFHAEILSRQATWRLPCARVDRGRVGD